MKDFLIIGGVACCGYKDVFPYIKSRVVKYRPEYYGIKQYLNTDVKVTATWYTTMETPYIPPLQLTKSYNPDDYHRYDNYDAINVDKTMNIPYDYQGVMGVPVSFLDKWNSEQFEIIWQASGNTRASAPTEVLKKIGYITNKEDRGGCGVISGVRQYSRLMIKNKMN